MLTITPSKTALLVIDPQNDFCHPEGVLAQSGVDVSQLVEAGSKMVDLVKLCQSVGIQDIWTQQINHVEDYSRVHKQIPAHTDKRKKYTAQPGSWGAEFTDELKEVINDKSEIMIKYRFNCFHDTNLETYLKIKGIKTLIVCGGTTNCCVDTTVRDAYMKDYDVIMIKDCIGGVRQDWHEMAFEVWKHYIGEVMTLDELKTLLN